VLQNTRHVQEIVVEKNGIKVHIPVPVDSADLKKIIEALGIAI
jgi:hypothetical protein